MEFENIKRMKNIRGTIVAEKVNGHRCEIPIQIIQGAIDILDKKEPKILGVDESTSYLLRQRLINLLASDGFEVYIL